MEFLQWNLPNYTFLRQVNLIEIQEQMEYLRDTIFYSFFGKSILFDDMESATEYRSSLVERGISPPIIYTMAGERILNSGILDPSKRGRLPSRLDYVFGQQSSTDSKEFKSLHAGMMNNR